MNRMDSPALTCEEARQRVHDCVDYARHDSVLEDHLIGCADCREYATDIRGIAAGLDGLHDETVSIVARPAVRGSSANQMERGWHAARRLLRPVRVAAAIALLVAGSLYVVPRWRASRRAAESNSPIPSMADAAKGHLPTHANPRLGITLQGKSATTMLAVAQQTNEKNIRMYWLYPLLDQETNVE